MRVRLNTRIYKHLPQIVDHLFNLLYHPQELGSTLLHDIRVPSSNRSSVKDNVEVVWRSSRFNNSTILVVGVVGELPSYSADAIQLRYSDKMSKNAEPAPNLIFGILAGGYGRKMGRRLDFNE
jgi:hypothetical protein